MRKPGPHRDIAEWFVIWRYGESVHWQCTYAELAQVTGLSVYKVAKHCRKRGYDLKRGERANSVVIPVDSYFELHSTSRYCNRRIRYVD